MFVLKTTVEEEMLEHIQNNKTPKEAWDTFVTHFSKKNNTKLQILENELLSISQCNMTMAQHLHKIKSFYWEITELNSSLSLEKLKWRWSLFTNSNQNIEASLLLYKDSPLNHLW